MTRLLAASKALRAVHPNAGIAAGYRKQITALIDQMGRSYAYWIKAAWRASEPVMAQDASPAVELDAAVRRLGRYWDRRFRAAAPKLARYFATAASRRSDAVLQAILCEAGISVKFTMTASMNDVLQATVAENVSLIRSIPQQFHTQVQGLVMRSVQTGRDLAPLVRDLQKQFGSTRKRAELIALDQNNKATSALQKARQTAMGIEDGVWMHSHAGKEPRPTHLANDGKRFSIAEGWFDPDKRVRRRIMPGELIRCFPASTRIQLADGVEKAYRRWYRGQLAEIITDSGKALRATPNHPILTPNGWVAAGLLNEGDYVVEVADHGINSVMHEGDADDREPMIAQIFDAVAKFGSSRSEVSLRDQFHGDGSTNGDVDIVLAARALFFGLNRFHPERVGQLKLAVSADSNLGGGPIDLLLQGEGEPSALLVGGKRQTFSSGRSLAFHPDKTRLAAASHLAAGRDDPGGDRVARDTVLFGQGQDARSSFVLITKPARIVRINYSTFDGHVFNLQTEAGHYLAEGIIVHNCRCTWKPVVKGFS